MSLRRITSVGLVACLLGAGLTACGSDDSEEEPPPAEGTILITNDNTFTSEADLHVGEPVATAASGHDVEVCYGDIAEDLQCHEAAAVKTLFLLRVDEPDRAKVIEYIIAGELEAHVGATLRYKEADRVSDHCVSLADFTAGSDEIEIDDYYFETDQYSYLLVFSSKTGVGTGTISMTFLEPSSGGDSVTAPEGCEQLEYSVDLHSLTPLEVPMDGPWPVNWGGLKRTGDGGDVPFSSIDRVLLAFYEGLTVKDLEDNIFDLEQLDAASFWEIEHDGTKRETDLALAKDSSGKAFPGFDNGKDGTWLMGLMCDTCTNPAPIMLTILEPTE